MGGAQCPLASLDREDDRHGITALGSTLVRDEYAAYKTLIIAQLGRIPIGCLARARRRFDELLRDGGTSAVADEALQGLAQIYRLELEPP